MKKFLIFFILTAFTSVNADDEIKVKDLNNSETNYQNTGDLADAQAQNPAATSGVSKEQLDTLKLQINQIKDNQKQSDEFLIELEKDL
jgi:hypothetical protein